jgi:outer membrane protein TolC
VKAALVAFVLVLSVGATRSADAQGASSPSPATPRAPSGGTSGPFLGGVPAGTATPEPIALTIRDTIDRALAHNLGVLTSEQGVREAGGARWQSLSDLLPHVTGQLREDRQKANLAALGFTGFPGIPSVIGPFNVFDARVYVSQPIVDLKALNDLRADSHNASAARYSYADARNLVVLVAANLYLQTLAESARAQAAAAQLDTARALHAQAVDMKQAGMVPAINVLRAEVEMNTQQQRATATRNDFEISKLRLARAIGLPIGQEFTLADKGGYAPAPEMTLDAALERAYRSRPDYQAALERVQAAEATRRAALGEALPAVRVNADYGTIGQTASTAIPTFSIAGAVSVPIFQGGRVRGRLIETDARLQNRRSEAEDLKAGIYYDVRSAFLDIQATSERLQVATSARTLSDQQLVQARDRFAAGVADNLEVVQAQEAVALSNEQYIDASYGFNVAKVTLARALGVAEQTVQEYLGGSR